MEGRCGGVSGIEVAVKRTHRRRRRSRLREWESVSEEEATAKLKLKMAMPAVGGRQKGGRVRANAIITTNTLGGGGGEVQPTLTPPSTQ